MAGIGQITNPLIERAGGNLPFIERNLIKAPLNVAEGLVMDRATDMETTPWSMLLDAVVPVGMDIASGGLKGPIVGDYEILKDQGGFARIKQPDDFRYHTTSNKALESIKKQGLKPSEGQYGKGVYFAPSEAETTAYGSPEEVMLRIKKSKLPKDYDEFPEQGWTENIVPPEFLEIKVGNKWQPLINKGVDIPNKLYHSSEDTFKSGKPEFDAYFGNESWRKSFAKEFGPNEYEIEPAKDLKILDLNKNTPEAENLIKKWGGTREDFYMEDWVDKQKMMPEIKKLGYDGATFQDEFLLTKEAIAKSNVAKGVDIPNKIFDKDIKKMTWFRGEGSNLGGKSGDKFFSANESVAGDYGVTRKIDPEEIPDNILQAWSKEDLAETIGYKGDPRAEPLNLKDNFDDLAKKYATEKGYKGIAYLQGTFDEPELHIFNQTKGIDIPKGIGSDFELEDYKVQPIFLKPDGNKVMLANTHDEFEGYLKENPDSLRVTVINQNTNEPGVAGYGVNVDFNPNIKPTPQQLEFIKNTAKDRKIYYAVGIGNGKPIIDKMGNYDQMVKDINKYYAKGVDIPEDPYKAMNKQAMKSGQDTLLNKIIEKQSKIGGKLDNWQISDDNYISLYGDKVKMSFKEQPDTIEIPGFYRGQSGAKGEPTQILDSIRDHAKSRGKTVTATHITDNDIEFWEKVGFQPVQTGPHSYDAVWEPKEFLRNNQIRDIGKGFGTEFDDVVARERFDIPNLKRLSGGGSDRDVFDLGDKVLKVTKTARGLEQNLKADYYAGQQGITPPLIESGKNYVVYAKADKPNAITKQMVKELKETGAPGLSYYNPKEYYKKISQWQDIFEKYNPDLNNIWDYGDDLLFQDMAAIRNWGSYNGKPVLIDEGSLMSKHTLDSFRNSYITNNFNPLNTKKKTNLDYPEFREIYNQSRTAKKKFGDLDKYTMYGGLPLLLGLQNKEEK